jgi:phosphatidylglycerol:prolipoprotein diacylglycerol transferase
MFPYFYQSASLNIGSYGVMLAVAYLVGRQIYLSNLNKAIKSQINWEILIIFLLVFGVIGAKLMFMLKNPDRASFDELSSFTDVTGFSSQGAIIGALFVVIVFSRFTKIPMATLLDSAAPAAVIAYALARVGCFLSGDDCWGKESHLPWAMAFPEGVKPTPPGVKVHPVPLYEIIYSISIWFYLNYLQTKNKPPYFIFCSLLLCWGFCRFLVEFVSTNEIKAGGMSGSQIGGLVMFLIGLGFFVTQHFSAKNLKTRK